LSASAAASKNATPSRPLLESGAALTALAAVVWCVALSRVCAVVVGSGWLWAVGLVALVALWAGGVLSRALSARRSLFTSLARLAAVSAALVVGSLALVLNHATTTPTVGLALAGAAPFVTAGAILASAVAEAGAGGGRVYLCTLLGAAGGCLLAAPLLGWLGGPNTAIGAGVLYTASAALWYTLAGSWRGRAVAVMAALSLVALVAVNARLGAIDVRYAKGEALRGERFVKWNSFSRVAVNGREPDRLRLRLDAEQAGYIAAGNLERLPLAERDALLRRGAGLAYLLRPGAKTLILNAGGGEEVVRALAGGSRDVTGVEANSIIADAVMRTRFSSANQGLYFRPDVRIAVQDGRSFVRHSREFYQVLQVTPDRAGDPARRFLLTAEALYSFLERLTEDGLLAVTLPGRDRPPQSCAAAAVRALERLGAREPRRHMILIRDRSGGEPAADTLLVSRQPFSPGEIGRCRQLAGAGSLIDLYPAEPPATAADGSFDGVAAPTDNRPYPAQPADPLAAALPRFAILGAAAVAATLGLALPAAGERRTTLRPGLRPLSFFVFSAAGYVSIQMALAEQLSLFVGHPASRLTVIVPALLAAAGLGGCAGRLLPGSSQRGLIAVLAAVALTATAFSMVLAPLVSFGVGWPLWLKVTLTLLITAPAGFLMGTPAAAGFALFGGHSREILRWAWTLHIAGALLGAAVAAVVLVRIGMRETLLFGGLFYLGALLATGWRRGEGVRQQPAAL